MYNHILFLLLVTIGIHDCLGQARPEEDEIGSPLLLPPGLRSGKLANGFSYYIMHNATPTNKVSFKLFVKVGWLDEEENEGELAHWLEHAVLSGSTSFPMTYRDYFQGVHGLTKGGDFNAMTHITDTEYFAHNLEIKDATVIPEALRWFRELTSEATLNPAKAMAEAGAVIGESSDLGVQRRLELQYMPAYFNHSRLGTKLGIPTKRNISQFDYASLKDFYERWYTPANQAIVIVGDIDVDSVESMVKAEFAKLTRKTVSVQHVDRYRIELNGANQYLVATDDEQEGIGVEVNYKIPKIFAIDTESKFTALLERNLLNNIVNKRLKDISATKGYKATFMLFRNRDFLDVISANSRANAINDLEETLMVLINELERLRRFGITADELSMAKDRYAKYDNVDLAEPSAKIAQDLGRFYVTGDVPLKGEYGRDVIARALEAITLTHINGKLAAWLAQKNRDIIVKAPTQLRSQLPTESTVNGWVARAGKDKSLTPYVPPVRVDGLFRFDVPPVARDARYIGKDTALDVHQYRLANGVIVYLKPADDPSIMLRGISLGGYLMYEGKDQPAGKFSAPVVAQNGVFNRTKAELQSYLQEYRAYLFPHIEPNFSFLSGRSPKQEVEVLLKAAHLYYVHPNRDVADADKVMAAINSNASGPGAPFLDSINFAIYGDRAKANEIGITDLDLNRSLEIYQERFKNNISNYTFYLTGGFDVESMAALINKYLGSISPASSRAERIAHHDDYAPTELDTTKERVFRADVKTDGAEVQLMFIAENRDQLAAFEFAVLTEILVDRLTKRLREKEGGVFTVSTGVFPVSDSRYQAKVYFRANTKDRQAVNALVAAALEELDALVEHGITEADGMTIKKLMGNWFQNELHGTNFLAYATNQYQKDKPLDEILRDREKLERMTIDDFNGLILKAIGGKEFMRFLYF